MGEYTIDLFADISTWEACTETRSSWTQVTSERSIRTIKDKIWNTTHFLFKFLGSCASYDPVWMILMAFVTYNGVLIWRRLLTAARWERWNGATGFAIPGSVFDPLPASTFDKPRSAADDAAVALPKITIIIILHFFFLIKKIHAHAHRSTRGQKALP